jgi:large subunit ribosomal protein L5
VSKKEPNKPKEKKEKKTEAAPETGAKAAKPKGPSEPSRLRVRYSKEIVPTLMKHFKYTNIMAVPKLEKIVINMGLGEAVANAKIMDVAVDELGRITGQRAVITRAKKSIANFKLRQHMPIGAAVTLRGDRMYEFLDRLGQCCSAARARLPRRFDQIIRWTWKLHHGFARSADLSGNLV